MTIRHVLCFGDSLTWGWKPVPEGTATVRYEYGERWTGVMAEALGREFRVIEEGLSGRTTIALDANDPRLDGSAYLPAALASHMPLDLVIIMLGTNDAKISYRRTAHDIGRGMARLAAQVNASAGGVGTGYKAPSLLIVSPPVPAMIPGAWLGAEFEGAATKIAALAHEYEALANAMGAAFLDAAQHITTGGSDGVHFTPENNRTLGNAMAIKVKSLLNAG